MEINRPPPVARSDRAADGVRSIAAVAALVDQLLELDEQLTALLGDETHAVTDSRGRTMLLRKAQNRIDAGEAARRAALLDALPVEVAVLDEHGRVAQVNESWRRSAAGENGEPGRSVGDVLDLDVLRADSEGPAFEYPVRTRGEERWFSAHLVPVRTGGSLVTRMDITRRKNAAAEMARLSLAAERRERMISLMLTYTADRMYAVDRDWRLIWANEPALRAWGRSLQEATGRSAAELGFSAEMVDRMHRQFLQVFDHGAAVKDEDVRRCG